MEKVLHSAVVYVFWRVLTYAGVCWRMLTYADTCKVLHSAVVYPGDFCSLPQVLRLC